jgi:PIN domain nuclease of toxin-antitoxin system
MRILLDTNIVLWQLYEIARLSESTKNLMVDAEQVLVSSATIWEIAIKVRIGRLKADVDEVMREIEARDLVPLPVLFKHARRVAELDLLHKDSFDRLLIAQAVTEGVHLLTADSRLEQYSDLVICV